MKTFESQDKLICIKAALFFVILIFWVTGVTFICIGALVQLRLSAVSVVLAETSSGVPLVLAIIGVVIFFLSGFGAFAILRESNVLIKIFAVIMLLVFVVEIVVGISAFTYTDQFRNFVSRRFLKVLHQYGQEPQITSAVDSLQQEFQCCGAQNFTDWLNTTSSVPKSCCRTAQLPCGKDTLDHIDNLFREGCVVKMRSWISQHIGLIGAVGLGFGFSQMVGILLSWLLVTYLRESYVSV